MVVKISAKQPQMYDAHEPTHMCDSMYMSANIIVEESDRHLD